MKNVHSISESKLKKIIRAFIGFFGFELRKKNNWYEKFRDSVVEIDPKYKKIIKKTESLINASLPNQWAIIQSLIHVKNFKVKGDIVETGVFHGGGLILINYILKILNLNKKIWGYDTFEGIPKIDLKYDEILGGGKIKINNKNDKLIYRNLNEVIKNLNKNGFSKLPTLIKGDTRKTLKIKKNIPNKISFIRLDTDFYESTLNELQTLYPKLSKNGVLMIDDYGHHKGAKKAVDTFFKNKKIWLHRVDYTARLVIKL